MGLDMYINKLKLGEGIREDNIKESKSSKISEDKIKSIALNGIPSEDKVEILKNHVEMKMFGSLQRLDTLIKRDNEELNKKEKSYNESEISEIAEITEEYIKYKEEYSKLDSYKSQEINNSYLMGEWLKDTWLLWDILSGDNFEYLGKEYKVRTVFSIRGEVVYWRKVNAIHLYMVRNLQNGNDDCGMYILSKEFLNQFKEDLEGVLSGKLACKEVMPTTSGFYFGSLEYDGYYYENLRYSYDEIEKLLKEYDKETKDGYIYYYSSSW